MRCWVRGGDIGFDWVVLVSGGLFCLVFRLLIGWCGGDEIDGVVGGYE